jgi:hypothetical protein
VIHRSVHTVQKPGILPPIVQQSAILPGRITKDKTFFTDKGVQRRDVGQFKEEIDLIKGVESVTRHRDRLIDVPIKGIERGGGVRMADQGRINVCVVATGIAVGPKGVM